MRLGDVARVDVDLHDLGGLGEVVDVVLRQGAEVGQPGAHGQDDVGLLQDAHGGLGAHVAYGAGPQRMVAGEGVVVQVGGRHRRAKVFGHGLDGGNAAGIHHAAPGDDHRVFGVLQHFHGGREMLGVADAAGSHAVLRGMQNVFIQLAVKIVARDVHKHRAAFGVGNAESRANDVGRALGMGYAQRGLGNGFKPVSYTHLDVYKRQPYP